MSILRFSLVWFKKYNPFGSRFSRVLPRGRGGRRRLPTRYLPSLEDLEARRLLSFNFFPAGSNSADITLGPDGNLWFTESSTIGRITPDGTVTHYAVPTVPRFGFGGITAGPDGNVWFTESRGELNQPSLIGRITPDGTVTEFSNLRVNSFTGGITAGADGNLWFTTLNHTGGPFEEVERITPDGVVTEFPAALGFGPITAGPDGNVWFAGNGNRIGRITPDGSVTTFDFPRSQIEGITAGPDGNVWVLASNYPGFNVNGAIVRVTPDGQSTEFPLPDQNQGPLGTITAGPDGNVWFTDGNHLGQITPDGAITEILVPPSLGFATQTSGITTGPDGNIWFISSRGIGQFVLDGIATVPTTTNLIAPDTAVVGQPVTFTVAVTSSAGTPTGSVLFLDNGNLLSSADLDATGHATLTTSLDVGFHAISALYAGTPDFAPSGDIRGVQVNQDDGGAPGPNAPGHRADNGPDLLASVAAIDAAFSVSHLESVSLINANPPTSATAADAALVGSRLALAPPPVIGVPVAADAGSPHQFATVRAETDAAELADLLAFAL